MCYNIYSNRDTDTQETPNIDKSITALRRNTRNNRTRRGRDKPPETENPAKIPLGHPEATEQPHNNPTDVHTRRVGAGAGERETTGSRRENKISDTAETERCERSVGWGLTAPTLKTAGLRKLYETESENKMGGTTFEPKFNETRTFGVEIEAAGLYPREAARVIHNAGIDCSYEGYSHEVMNSWKVVTDVSLRGGRTFEAVSPPLKGRDGLEEIAKVVDALDDAGATVNKSCGIHVHHDVNGMSTKGIRSVIFFYAQFEEEVFDMLHPPSRRGNNNDYCRSLNTLNLHSFRYWQNQRDAASYSGVPSRYFKVNPHAYIKYGTLEFRQHAGSLNADKITNWVVLTQTVIERFEHGAMRLTPIKEHMKTMYSFGCRLGLNKAECDIVNDAWDWAKKRVAHFRKVA